MPITLKLLKELKACKTQVEEFQKLFGEEAPMTIEAATDNCSVFDWCWIASKILTPGNFVAFMESKYDACDKYYKIERNAWEEYRMSDVREYLNSEDSDWEKQYKQYIETKNTTNEEYLEVIAKAFAELYIEQESVKNETL